MSRRLMVECFLLGMVVNVLADLCGEPWFIRYTACALCGWAHSYAFMSEEEGA